MRTNLLLFSLLLFSSFCSPLTRHALSPSLVSPLSLKFIISLSVCLSLSFSLFSLQDENTPSQPKVSGPAPALPKKKSLVLSSRSLPKPIARVPPPQPSSSSFSSSSTSSKPAFVRKPPPQPQTRSPPAPALPSSRPPQPVKTTRDWSKPATQSSGVARVPPRQPLPSKGGLVSRSKLSTAPKTSSSIVAAPAPSSALASNVLPTSTGGTIQLTSALLSTLLPHQRLGVEFLSSCTLGATSLGPTSTGALMCDSTGLGKTVQSIAVLYDLYKRGKLARGEWAR